MPVALMQLRGLRRQGIAACTLGLLALLALAEAAAHDGPHGDAASVIDSRHRQTDPRLKDARAELLARAEAELARGDTVAAGESFERAAMMLHAADTEMGLVRSYMQAGQYARALAFCAHTAGVHREAPAAGALYAWLLRAGGQTAFSERTLQQSVQRAPRDAVVLATQRAFASALPVANPELLQTPHRMAPQPVMLGGQPGVPQVARVSGGGVLVGQGLLALVPLTTAQGAAQRGLWVRNGLGQTTRARLQADAGLEAQGIALLRLDSPMDAGDGLQSTTREPFAGSPGFAAQYAPQQDAQPAWPWLSLGFFGAFPAQGGARSLGIEQAGGANGGPVFDAQGQLAGMALPGPAGEALMIPAARWQAAQAGLTAPAQAPAPVRAEALARPAPAEQVYEAALRLALQVIVLPPRAD